MVVAAGILGGPGAARPAVSWSFPAPPARMGEPALSVRLTLHRLHQYQRTGPERASGGGDPQLLSSPRRAAARRAGRAPAGGAKREDNSSPRAGKGPPGPVATQARGRSREYPGYPSSGGRRLAAGPRRTPVSCERCRGYCIDGPDFPNSWGSGPVLRRTGGAGAAAGDRDTTAAAGEATRGCQTAVRGAGGA